MGEEEPKSSAHLCRFSSRDLTATSVCLQIKIEHNLTSISDDYLNQQIIA